MEPSAGRRIGDRFVIVNAERRVNRGGDIFGVNGPVLAPARISDAAARAIGLAERPATLHPAADHGGAHGVLKVIAAAARIQIARRPAKLAHHHNESGAQIAAGAQILH